MRLTSAAAIAVAVLCTLLPVAGKLYSDRTSGTMMVSFRASYCAALAARKHADPYHVHPLHDCESRSPHPYYRVPPRLTVPAAYPPYVLALISPLTRLPFGSAALLWWAILAGACITAAAMLARVAQLPFLVSWAALVLPLGLSSFAGGQIVPICVAALLVAAFFAQRGHWGPCALAIGVAMMEPHIALPAAIAFFLRYGPIRHVLVLTVALLGAISIDFGGLPLNAEYLTSVLPAHALLDVSLGEQYSLSAILSHLGVADTQAVLAGCASYAVLAALGVVLGIRLARRYYEPAFVALIPPAFTLIDGSFVHTVEMVAAVPVCVLLYARTSSYRRALIVPLILLAVPWVGSMSASLFLAPLFPIAYLTYVLGGRRRIAALASALGSMSAIVLFFMLRPRPVGHFHAAHLTSQISAHLAEASWQAFALAHAANDPIGWLLRWPTWAGLIVLAVILSRETGSLRVTRVES